MSPRYEIERYPDGTEIEYRETHPLERVAVYGITALASVCISLGALNFIGGGGIGLSVFGGAKDGAGSVPPAAASYGAPNTPVIAAVVFDDSSVYTTANAFVGSLDDSIDYTVFEYDSLRGDFSTAPILVDTQTYASGHVLRSDTLINAALSGDTLKVRALHHGMASSLSSSYSAVDTFVMATVTASTYDPYLPAAWTDTVHYEDFTGLVANTRFDSISGATGDMDAPWTLETVAYDCQGGSGNSGYNGAGTGGLCRGQDSVVFANQASPPWVFESFLDTDEAQGLQFGIVFADGNGSGAAANLTRVYVRYSIFYEANGVGIGGQDYTWHSGSNKYWMMNTTSNGFMIGWDGESTVFAEQTSPSSSTCDDTYGLEQNTWTDYYAADTINTLAGVPECSGVGTGGWNTRGVWQHRFICFDFSPAAGSRIVSWGMYSADEQGIAAYHDDMTNYNQVGAGTATDFDGWIWNGTWGGLPKTHPAQSIWFDDLLVMTGSSGSCVTPPSFS